MKLNSLLSIITLSLHATIVAAWTQYQNFGNRLLHTVLRLRDQDDVEHERTRLENLWGVTSDLNEGLPALFTSYDQIKSLPVGEWTEGVNNEWSDVCFGDECDQCEIPADFRDDSVQLDVLDFLGITRAEPLRVEKRL